MYFYSITRTVVFRDLTLLVVHQEGHVAYEISHFNNSHLGFLMQPLLDHDWPTMAMDKQADWTTENRMRESYKNIQQQTKEKWLSHTHRYQGLQ